MLLEHVVKLRTTTPDIKLKFFFVFSVRKGCFHGLELLFSPYFSAYWVHPCPKIMFSVRLAYALRDLGWKFDCKHILQLDWANRDPSLNEVVNVPKECAQQHLVIWWRVCLYSNALNSSKYRASLKLAGFSSGYYSEKQLLWFEISPRVNFSNSHNYKKKYSMTKEPKYVTEHKRPSGDHLYYWTRLPL